MFWSICKLPLPLLLIWHHHCFSFRFCHNLHNMQKTHRTSSFTNCQSATHRNSTAFFLKDAKQQNRTSNIAELVKENDTVNQFDRLCQCTCYCRLVIQKIANIFKITYWKWFLQLTVLRRSYQHRWTSGIKWWWWRYDTFLITSPHQHIHWNMFQSNLFKSVHAW